MGTTSADSEETALPLASISEPTLKKIIEYCEHHKEDPPAVPTVPVPPKKGEPVKAKDSTIKDEWDQEFIKNELPVNVNLLLAANYLELKPLFELMCKCFAGLMRGKTPEQLREYFGLPNDLTEEELDNLRVKWGGKKKADQEAAKN